MIKQGAFWTHCQVPTQFSCSCAFERNLFWCISRLSGLQIQKMNILYQSQSGGHRAHYVDLCWKVKLISFAVLVPAFHPTFKTSWVATQTVLWFVFRCFPASSCHQTISPWVEMNGSVFAREAVGKIISPQSDVFLIWFTTYMHGFLFSRMGFFWEMMGNWIDACRVRKLGLFKQCDVSVWNHSHMFLQIC